MCHQIRVYFDIILYRSCEKKNGRKHTEMFLPSPALWAENTEEFPLWEVWTHEGAANLRFPKCPDTTQRLRCPAADWSLLRNAGINMLKRHRKTEDTKKRAHDKLRRQIKIKTKTVYKVCRANDALIILLFSSSTIHLTQRWYSMRDTLCC